MAKILQLRRGTTAAISAITGAEGELFVDLDKNAVVVMDGSTQGGHTLQPELVSGTNIKSVNGTSLVGSGDVDLSTNLALVGNELRYTNIDGTLQTVDLSPYLDDTTNTIVSGVLSGDNITFTREDATTFTVNVAALYDDTNLVTSVAGRTGVVVLAKADVGLANVDNTADSAKSVLEATRLTTSRTVGGVSFNGTANINLPGVNTTGNQNTTGSAATLTTARTLTIGSTGKTFNGSANVAWTLTEIGALQYNPTTRTAGQLYGGTDNPASTTRLNYDGNLHVNNFTAVGDVNAVNVNSTSDERTKKNISTIENALEKTLALRGVEFDWKESGNHSLGLIAQEVEKVIPELVSDDGTTKSVSYGNIVGLLIEAIKNQQQQIDELKKIITN